MQKMAIQDCPYHNYFMTSQLQDLIKFMEFMNKFKLIKRAVFVGNDNPRRFENDAEHSYELAMLAWYLIESHELNLNKDECIKFALVHDLVEVYAGDMDPYSNTKNTKFQITKDSNESLAKKRITQEFQDFPELIQAMQAYEDCISDEAKFIYSLDKLVGQFGAIYIDKLSLKDYGLSKETIQKIKDKKISKSEIVMKYYNEAVENWNETEDFYALEDFVPEFKRHYQTINQIQHLITKF